MACLKVDGLKRLTLTTSFHPLDATKVQKLYFQTKNAFPVAIRTSRFQKSRKCASRTSGCYRSQNI
jgi:hypothetical protein